MVAVLALSTSVLMLRESRLAPGTLSCWRLLFAAIILSPWFVRGWIRHRGVDFRPAMLRHSVVPGLLLALHFTTWVIGARATEVANASLIVNMVPAVLPLLLWFLIREKIRRHEIVGTGIAFAGVLVLSGADLTVSAATARGDLICFGSMLLLAAYLAFGRRNGRALPDVWLYVVPLYFIASAGSLGLAWSTGQKIELPVGRELVLVTALAIGPTILGHALINYTLRHLPGQRVAVASQCQFVAAGMLELGINGVLPTWGFYIAAPLVLIGAWVVITAKDRQGEVDSDRH
ncbi:MAG: DMT family transporter [Verrucomicrobia bacterium]|nr:DMT family transporter [Verrucomicrobiota bacterium]